MNSQTGKVVTLYSATGQTEHGPGVGAATWNSVEPKVLFIHGMRNSTAEQPYGMTRRTGVMVDDREPGKLHFLDARDIDPPFTFLDASLTFGRLQAMQGQDTPL